MMKSSSTTRSHVYFWGAIGVKGIQSNTPHLIATSEKKAPSGISNPSPLVNTKIIQVSAGGSFLLLLDDQGHVYALGKNQDFRLGMGDEKDRLSVPVKIPTISNASVIAAGYRHGSCLVRHAGESKVMLWGKLSSSLQFTKPTVFQVPCASDDEVVSIRAGNGYSCALTRKGHVFMIGKNTSHKCGFKEENCDVNSFTPLVFSNGSEIVTEFKDIDLGYDSTLAIATNGDVYGFGSNACFQLGIGNVRNKSGHLPTKVNFSQPIEAVQVACSRGSSHHCHGMVLDSNGFMHTFGSGYKYKLGTQTTDDQPVPVKIILENGAKIKHLVPGGIHNFAQTVDNSLLSFGCGSDGRLGHQESENYRYLYKELEPRKIEDLGNRVVMADSDYYFGVALCE
ncbi:hypothetical protein C9374_013250 [Naegleria lovaniensis]|uniref:Regulator of chromosome condensation n=1 Tax=Naegleria lovaniensis TaxID=51637 RepID=A0AA88KV80_NAELO|nr:uncharacterized protein C9374_013250 [Naegleria lovaniensis]KAG2391765.1 hypothetical protein C9374_013250 [Naegleria lovaniensis]